MGAPQYEQAGADIGGTGTTNTIPRWTGPSTLGDSGLIDNGTTIYTTTRNFGIGTASPITRAHVVGTGTLLAGTAYQVLQASQDQTTYRGAILGYDSSGQIGIVAAATSAAGSNLAFWTYSGSAWGERARIDSSGNVGIGTASPGSILHTRRDTAAGRTNITFENGAASNVANKMRLRLGPTLAFVGTDLQPYVESYCENPAGELAGLAFGTFNGTALFERARIDSAGRLLVGTSTAPPAGGSSIRMVIADPTGSSCGQEWNNNAGGGAVIPVGANLLNFYGVNGAPGAETYTLGMVHDASNKYLSLTQSGWGLKLPATPGNTDPNTLDAYVDGGTAGSGGKTWTIADNSGAGLALTITSCEYIQVGKAITICVDVTFPVTASAANANLSLPVAAKGNWHAGTVAFQSAGAGGLAELTVMCNGAEIAFYAGTTSTRQTNVNLSNKRLIFSITYFTAQ